MEKDQDNVSKRAAVGKDKYYIIVILMLYNGKTFQNLVRQTIQTILVLFFNDVFLATPSCTAIVRKQALVLKL